MSAINQSADNDLRSADSQKTQPISPASAVEVLALVIDVGLTKQQYSIIPSFVYTDILAPYKTIQLEKRSTLIKLFLASAKAEVKLQSFLDNTATRIAQLQVDVLKTIDDASNSS